MCIEIEAKLKVDSLQEIKSKLLQLGAESLEEQLQTDCYFDDAHKTLSKADRCLRLRRQTAGERKKTTLTYKGPKEKNRFKRRRQIEIEIQDTDSAEKLLCALGYKKALVVEKRRRLWRLGDCDVALDELPLLGEFVEIEGPDEEKIAEVQKTLGLSHLPHIPKSYASLTEQKLKKLTPSQAGP